MRAYLKAAIFASALLAAGVLVSPSAQYSIQRGFNYVADYIDIIGGSSTWKLTPSGTSLLLQASTGGAFSTVGTFTSGGQLLSLDGTDALPSQSFATNPDSGRRWSNSFGLLDVVGGVGRVAYGNGFLGIPSTSTFSWWSGALSGGGDFDLRLSRLAAGSMRIGSTSDANTYDIILADWGTTVSAEPVSVADTVVLAGPASGVGTLTISIGTDNNVCVFALTGTAAPVELNDPGTLCSITAGTATSLNVYYSAGYQIQNLRGGTRALRSVFIGG